MYNPYPPKSYEWELFEDIAGEIPEGVTASPIDIMEIVKEMAKLPRLEPIDF
jgi:hypothetical protein